MTDSIVAGWYLLVVLISTILAQKHALPWWRSGWIGASPKNPLRKRRLLESLGLSLIVGAFSLLLLVIVGAAFKREIQDLPVQIAMVSAFAGWGLMGSLGAGPLYKPIALDQRHPPAPRDLCRYSSRDWFLFFLLFVLIPAVLAVGFMLSRQAMSGDNMIVGWSLEAVFLWHLVFFLRGVVVRAEVRDGLLVGYTVFKMKRFAYELGDIQVAIVPMGNWRISFGRRAVPSAAEPTSELLAISSLGSAPILLSCIGEGYRDLYARVIGAVADHHLSTGREIEQ